MRLKRVAWRSCGLPVLLVGCLLLLPSAASAQATLTGVVRDASGAVLPGVTVEAASPALIEKVRTAVTESTGQYSIVNLRPGIYTVTFTLTGFTPIKRENVQLAGEQVTTLSVDLRVGDVAETITVTGEAPTVETQSTTKQQVMNNEVINALPTGRNYHSFGVLLAGVNTNHVDSGGALGDPMASLTVHGSRPGDQRVMQNGVNTMTLQAGGDIGIAVPNPGMAAEVTIDTSGISAEQSQGGVRINYIPRDGGNMFSGTTVLSYSTRGMETSNLSSDLIAKGFASANSVKKIYDINPGFGGPIRKDRVWFYFTGRVNRADQYAGGVWVNKNGYKPNVYTIDYDKSQPAYNATLWTDGQVRLTIQATPKNKVAFTWDQETRCSCPGDTKYTPWAVSATTTPEASANFRSPTQRLLHAEWSSPVTNKLLLEGLLLHRTERWGFMNPDASVASDFVSPAQDAVLRSGALVPIIDSSTGIWSHGNFLQYNNNWVPNFFYRAAASYVTGGHQLKAGFSNAVGYLDSTVYNYSPYSFITNIVPGAPVHLIVENVRPIHTKSDQNYDLGVFAQDRWTVNRFTLNLGVRYDTYKASAPPQHMVGATALTPNRPDVDFPYTPFNHWQDITPRFGLSWDVTGDGKTAVKVSLNKYLQSQTVGNLAGFAGAGGLNPINRLVNSTPRVWIDANGDMIPQCDLTNGGFQVSPATGDICQPFINPNFGLNDPNAQQFDHDLYFGWGKRPFNWEFGASVQREILRRVSLDVGYFRRWYGNFQVTDDLALSTADFTQFSVKVPTKPGLSSSGTSVTIFDKNKVVGQQLFTTLASNYGKEAERWNGVDIGVNARLNGGVFFFGGFDIGKTMLDTCEVAAKVPESLIASGAQTVMTPLNYCHTESPWLFQIKGNGSYIVPKIDVLLSATLVSVQGPAVLAQLNVSARADGSPLNYGNQLVSVLPGAPNAANQPISSEYGERLNQLDLRVAKAIRVGRTRTSLNLDVFNLFNANAVTRENPNFAVFRQPTEIMLARFAKIGAQFSF